MRDEADHFERMVGSIVAQTHRPAEWVIVDDGSSDGTRLLARELAQTHDWIIAIDSGLDGDRARGGRVVRAFERGRLLLPHGHDFVVKLDGDITLPPDYFERVAETFERDERVCSFVTGTTHPQYGLAVASLHSGSAAPSGLRAPRPFGGAQAA